MDIRKFKSSAADAVRKATNPDTLSDGIRAAEKLGFTKEEFSTLVEYSTANEKANFRSLLLSVANRVVSPENRQGKMVSRVLRDIGVIRKPSGRQVEYDKPTEQEILENRVSALEKLNTHLFEAVAVLSERIELMDRSFKVEKRSLNLSESLRSLK